MGKDKSFKENSVKVIFLGGVGEIGKNMTLLEYNDEMIMLDAGQAFGDEEIYGIDAVIPDVSYVLQNMKKLKGIFLTHGHEDHIGALRYYSEIFKKIPVYGTALTLGLVERHLKETKTTMKLNVVKEGETVKCGQFSVEFIKVAHSMAGSCALAVRTPVGIIFDTGDFKFDSTAVDGKNTDLQRIARVGAEGVLLMLGESTNVERKGHSQSEKVVMEGLESIFREYFNKRIIITTFASSNYRVQEILNIAKKFNRKVLLAGKSMKGIVEVAEQVGELKIPQGIIVNKIDNLKPSQVVIIATGSQGEDMSALQKMSQSNSTVLDVSEKDVVVFSSSPIPGNEKAIFDVVNNLYKQGCDVIYDSLNDVHVSGHAYEEELKDMLEIVKPNFFMPIHGEYRHQARHAKLAESQGIRSSHIAIPQIGDVYAVNKDRLHLQSTVKCGNVYIDEEVIENGEQIVGERKNMAENGLILILASIDTKRCVLDGYPEIICKGFAMTDEFEAKLAEQIALTVASSKNAEDLNEMGYQIKRAVSKLAMKRRQFPIVLPILVRA
ncbi:MAG: ribonuclease J [Clostridia bacterium]|nr:ribonuclease J [Clostridia bacterium]